MTLCLFVLVETRSWHMLLAQRKASVHPSHSQCFDHLARWCQSWHYVVESAETNGQRRTAQSQHLSFCSKKLPVSSCDIMWILRPSVLPDQRFDMFCVCVWINKIHWMTRWNTLGHVLAPNLRRDCVRGPNPAGKFDLSKKKTYYIIYIYVYICMCIYIYIGQEYSRIRIH